MVAGGHLGDLAELEVFDDVLAAARYDEVGVAIDRLETPAIEMIDVRMRDEDGVDPAGRAGTPGQERVKDDPRLAELSNCRSVAQPRDAGGRSRRQLGRTRRIFL